MRGERRGLLEPTIFALVGVTILVGLGIWQLDRKVWKENLIAALNTRLAQAPGDLPPREDWAGSTASVTSSSASAFRPNSCPASRRWFIPPAPPSGPT